MITPLALVTASALGTAGLLPAWDSALRPAALHGLAPIPAANGSVVGIELCRPAGALWLGGAAPFRLPADTAAPAEGSFRIDVPASVPVCSESRPAPDRFLTVLPIDPEPAAPGDPGQTVLASTAHSGGTAPVAARAIAGGGSPLVGGGGGDGTPLAGQIPAASPAIEPPLAAVPLPGALAALLGALGALGAVAGRVRRPAG